MSVIGNFKNIGYELDGEINALTIQAKQVRIIPAKKATDAGPTHRVNSGRAEIGAAWTKRSKEGKPYLSVLLDDPSLMAPFYASLVSSDETGDHNLLWSRGTRRERD